MTVAGGKYVTDDVYVEIIGGGREGPEAQVEWRIRRTLSLVSKHRQPGRRQAFGPLAKGLLKGKAVARAPGYLLGGSTFYPRPLVYRD
jgi:hypothetical protein